MEQGIRLVIPDADMDLIRQNARNAEIGGVSSVRTAQDRQDNLVLDQLVGQLCNYAAVRYLTGSIDGYMEARDIANRNKYVGDGGRDVPGFPIDVKGSLMRRGRNPLDYRLLVRTRERHHRWVYVLALVESLELPVTVHLVGWTRDADLPPADADGPFRGAHTVWAEDLEPIQKLQKVVGKFWESRTASKEERRE